MSIWQEPTMTVVASMATAHASDGGSTDDFQGGWEGSIPN